MGIGRITEAREVTQGVVHAAHGGAGEAARQMAASGHYAGREAQHIAAHGMAEAEKAGEAMKTAGQFAVAALWEKPIAEAEEKLRELDLECRSKGWRDENGVERPGFDLVRGAEAAQIGDQWDAYMARKAKEITKNLTTGQREELSRRTAKFRTETRARLMERGTRELITSNLADIDAIAVKSGERNVMEAVNRAKKDVKAADLGFSVDKDAKARDDALAFMDDAEAEWISDNLVEKRAKLIRDKVIGGLGRKSEAVATAEADKIVRAEALETVKALAAAGHYDRARKLVAQGRKLGYDDAALAKGREIVDKYEEKAQKDAFNGVQAKAQSAVAMGRLNGSVDPKTGAELPGMEDVLAAIRGAKEKFAVGTEIRAKYDKLEDRVDAAADKETVRSLENAVLADGSYKPEGVREQRMYPSVMAKVDEMRRKDRTRATEENDRGIMYDELMLDYEIQSGTLSEGEIGRRMRDIHERATALARGQLLKPEDYAAFGKRWKARNAADESAAGMMFDRAFGLSLENFVDARGDISTEITDKSYKDTLRSGQKAVFPGADKNVSLGEYLKWRAAFLGQLRVLPQDANRKQHAKELLGRFKAGWYARQTEANIEALSRTMNDIHLGIESEVEAERLKAAAEEEKRNMPVVDRRHPANADPNPDPLEFYRQANPLDPTLNFR